MSEPTEEQSTTTEPEQTAGPSPWGKLFAELADIKNRIAALEAMAHSDHNIPLETVQSIAGVAIRHVEDEILKHIG